MAAPAGARPPRPHAAAAQRLDVLAERVEGRRLHTADQALLEEGARQPDMQGRVSGHPVAVR